MRISNITKGQVLLLVPAGRPVDNVLDALLPLLSKGDVVVDHGNSHADDTERRQATTAAVGVHFVGCGTSGGEQGARVGPCLMPGGSFEAWKVLQPVLEPAAAVVKGPPGATPHPGRRDDLCVAYVGGGGSGHYVKMVHNGIEYGDMQLIAEAADFCHTAARLSPSKIADFFDGFADGPLSRHALEQLMNSW